MSISNQPDRIARALYRAVELPGADAPYNAASLKIYYPARYGDSAEERNSGVIPADPGAGACPVVILLPGINLSPESYSWLAAELALHGCVTVMPSLVAEEMPGYISLTPGLSIEALTPDHYGKIPSATLLGPILEELQRINAQAPLAGHLDLESVILGGHSAGGTVALLNARRDWLPGIAGAFSYGAHAAAASALGYPDDHFFELSSDAPMLILGGTRDGCIANSAGRYGSQSESGNDITAATDKLVQTFERAMTRDRGDSYLVLLEGANHFALAHPQDGSTGRPFIDFDATGDPQATRELLARLVCSFVDGALGGAAPGVETLCGEAGALVADYRCR